MNSENIQLAQMDIIRQVLNVSDMNILERIKTFLVNSKEGDDVYAKNSRISVKLQKDIDEARQEYKNGETLHFQSAADAQQWMESL
nr:hypothetical protein [Prevotella sp.]